MKCAVFYVYFTSLLCCLVAVKAEPVTVHDGTTLFVSHVNGTIKDHIVALPPGVTIKLQMQVPYSQDHFILFQAHSQIVPTILSYDSVPKLGYHVKGTNIGLVSMLGTTGGPTWVFLFNPSNVNVTVLTFAQSYDVTAPIPGACNQESLLSILPVLNVSYTEHMVSVEHALAGEPYSPFQIPHACNESELEYEVYHHHMLERDFSETSYFATIRMMRTVEGARKLGLEASEFGIIPETRNLFSAYPGTGRAFSVIVSYVGMESVPSAAYVPAITYACDLTVENSCQVLTTTYSKILCAVSIFVSLFIAFFGHRYFQTEMFVMGCVASALVAFICLVKFNTTLTITGLASVTTLTGVIGGIVWWLFWWRFGVPVASIILPDLLLGFLAASIVFYFPISIEFLTSDFNFWMSFTCCLLVLPVFLLPFTRTANIISCAVLGSYGVIIPVDHYMGTSLKYIIVNTLRRTTVPEFGRAILNPPYQTRDWILTLVGCGLILVAALFQFVVEKDRPPFPPTPYYCWKQRRALANGTMTRPEAICRHSSDETRPLLPNYVESHPSQQQPNYSTT